MKNIYKILTIISLIFLVSACNDEETAEDLSALHFIATGNEPGWKIEIKNEQIDIIADYGQTRETANLGKNLSKEKNIMMFDSVDKNNNNVSIIIEEKNCQDTMSETFFEYTTTFSYGETSLYGCGRMVK